MVRIWCWALFAARAIEAQSLEVPRGLEVIPDIVYASTGGRDLGLDLLLPPGEWAGPAITVRGRRKPEAAACERRRAADRRV